MPVVTGLYTLLLPMAVFAVLGSSRHLVVGADSATAAILGAALAGLAVAGSAQYVRLAGLVALLAGGLLLLARLARLGFLANFLSRTVLVGFLTGVGIQVAAGQLPDMLGVSATGKQHAWPGSWTRRARSRTCTGADRGGVGRGHRDRAGCPLGQPQDPGAADRGDRRDHREPGGRSGRARRGRARPVPRGLPHLGLPALGWHDAAALHRHRGVDVRRHPRPERGDLTRLRREVRGAFSEDTDLVGLGAANVAAAFSGTFVVNGSPTQTQMADSAGGRSQLAQLTTAAVVLIVLLVAHRAAGQPADRRPGGGGLPHRRRAHRRHRDAAHPGRAAATSSPSPCSPPPRS